MSPGGYLRRLSALSSRERHSDRGVIFTFSWFSHAASTFLSPLAPPAYVDRLHRYYEDSDFCRPASFGPCRCRLVRSLGATTCCSRAWVYHPGATRAPHLNDTFHPRLIVRQISLLNSFDLPTIPPPTTASPFRYDRFVTLLHRRSLPRLPPRRTVRSRGMPSRGQGFAFSQQAPRQAWPKRVRFTTDWSFVSGCSPPFLVETQLPLSTSGR